MIYRAILGNRYIIDKFEGTIDLKQEHQEKLPGKVRYESRNTVLIETPLIYEVGQSVSIGGFELGGKKFRLLELTITDYPNLPHASIVEILNNQELLEKEKNSRGFKYVN